MDDLISRTALLKDLSYCAPELWQDEEYVKAKIMKQPAVDAAPVKRGRWEDRGSLSCRCSRCGCKSNAEYNYCPNCGGKMDGERREQDG